jgi:hypothetical protein
MLRSVWGRYIVLNAGCTQVFGERGVAELPSSISDQLFEFETGLMFKERLEFKNGNGGVRFLFEKCGADEPSVLVNQRQEVTTPGIGGRCYRANEVTVDHFKRVRSGIKVTTEGYP